jgi:V-type H+-transporting ATPase subunit G
MLPHQNPLIQRAGSTSDLQSQVDKATNEKLEMLRRAYESHKDDVLQKLLDRVVLVKPELHRNLKNVQ